MMARRTYTPRDSQYAMRVRESFDRQPLMATIGARLERVEAGEVDIALPFRDDLTQQNGYLHAGIVSAVIDTSCGYAAYSLMRPDMDVLTAEFKINFLAPANGSLLARGKVIRPGRTLTVCSGEVVVLDDLAERLVAVMQATVMAVSREQ